MTGREEDIRYVIWSIFHSMGILFREHRESLEESSTTEVRIDTYAQFTKHLSQICAPIILKEEIKIGFCGHDERINKDIYVVAAEKFGVIGFISLDQIITAIHFVEPDQNDILPVLVSDAASLHIDDLVTIEGTRYKVIQSWPQEGWSGGNITLLRQSPGKGGRSIQAGVQVIPITFNHEDLFGSDLGDGEYEY